MYCRLVTETGVPIFGGVWGVAVIQILYGLLVSAGFPSSLLATRTFVSQVYPMLRNSASGPEIGLPGRISAGFYSG